MRKIQYLSPTSLSKFYEDQTAFYLNYLAEQRPQREPQTDPMAAGSAFDAFVKSYLHEKLYGKGKDPRFDLSTLFEAQVEPHARDKAQQAGIVLFAEYLKSGALTDLMTELSQSVTDPRFEFDLHGVVNHQREGETRTLGPVPFLGKPDLFFTNKEGARVIFDWKVNGYYSKSGASPKTGYVRLREGGFQTGAHKAASPIRWKGVFINIASPLNMVDQGWAQQLSIYSWLCGEDVGSQDFVAAIDQVVCRPGNIRFAEHRAKVQADFQLNVFRKAQEAWEIIHSDHYFRNHPKEVSQQRCSELDNYVKTVLEGPEVTNEEWLARTTRAY